MTLLYNRFSVKKNRRCLRTVSTKAEVFLWNLLRNRRFQNLKFKRQYSVKQFVIDFYCPALKLAVELDGEVHDQQDVKKHDQLRDEFLNTLGITVLRFANRQVLENTGEVLEEIKNFINQKK